MYSLDILHSPTTYSWATRSLMLQLFPATHVYLPVSSVVTSMINREPLGIFWNLEERREGTDEGGGLELQDSEGARKKGSTTLKFLKPTFSNLQPSCGTKIVFHCWTKAIGAIYFPKMACVRGRNILIAQKGKKVEEMSLLRKNVFLFLSLISLTLFCDVRRYNCSTANPAKPPQPHKPMIKWVVSVWWMPPVSRAGGRVWDLIVSTPWV